MKLFCNACNGQGFACSGNPYQDGGNTCKACNGSGMGNEPPSFDQFTLVLTCGACPEQYDVFLAGEQVGYLRLRHGFFTARYPDCGGEIIYESQPNGDGLFDSDERAFYLDEAITALKTHINSRKEN